MCVYMMHFDWLFVCLFVCLFGLVWFGLVWFWFWFWFCFCFVLFVCLFVCLLLLCCWCARAGGLPLCPSLSTHTRTSVHYRPCTKWWPLKDCCPTNARQTGLSGENCHFSLNMITMKSLTCIHVTPVKVKGKKVLHQKPNPILHPQSDLELIILGVF